VDVALIFDPAKRKFLDRFGAPRAQIAIKLALQEAPNLRLAIER
jgi:hypothetical protein